LPQIKLARTAGFCFGVENAVRLADDLIRRKGGEWIATLGDLIHNKSVVDRLRAVGVVVAYDYRDLRPEHKRHVVIRAHGAAPEVYEHLAANNIEFSDATCPNVKKIQMLAKEKHESGMEIILIGDKDHPEIIGINGWCGNSAVIFDKPEDIKKITGDSEKCVLVQTTFDVEKFEEIIELLKKEYPGIEVHNTICASTSERRKEAAALAGESDIMIVIGSKKSSNTQMLFDVCEKNCKETWLIETAGGLPPINTTDTFKAKRIGVTAGASTPGCIIKEVIEVMEETRKSEVDINFEEEMESSLVTLRTGQTVKGRIIRYNSSEVYVDLGYKSDGVIPIEDFVSEIDQEPGQNIKINDVIEVFVVRVSDSEGTVLLSKKKVDEKNNWSKMEEAFEKGDPINAVIIDVTNGGLVALSGGVRVFIPASQVSDRYVEDLREYLKRSVKIKIIDYNKQKKKFVGSMRVLILEDKKKKSEEIWNTIEVGKEYTGVVKSLTSFGAFVDIGGVDGLVHISELSWGRIRHPSEALKVGETVNVRVAEFDREKRKISLGYKKEEDNPWYEIDLKYPVGSIVTKKVVRIASFGAFIELEKGVDALVHVSQISDTRIAKPDDVLKVGMEVTAKVMDVNVESKKISLSIKEVEPIPYIDPSKPEVVEVKKEEEDEFEMPQQNTEALSTSLGDVLSAKMLEQGIRAGVGVPDDDEEAAETEEAPAGAAESAGAPAGGVESAEPTVVGADDAVDVKKSAVVGGVGLAEEPAGGVVQAKEAATGEADTDIIAVVGEIAGKDVKATEAEGVAAPETPDDVGKEGAAIAIKTAGGVGVAAAEETAEATEVEAPKALRADEAVKATDAGAEKAVEMESIAHAVETAGGVKVAEAEEAVEAIEVDTPVAVEIADVVKAAKAEVDSEAAKYVEIGNVAEASETDGTVEVVEAEEAVEADTVAEVAKVVEAIEAAEEVISPAKEGATAVEAKTPETDKRAEAWTSVNEPAIWGPAANKLTEEAAEAVNEKTEAESLEVKTPVAAESDEVESVEST